MEILCRHKRNNSSAYHYLNKAPQQLLVFHFWRLSSHRLISGSDDQGYESQNGLFLFCSFLPSLYIVFFTPMFPHFPFFCSCCLFLSSLFIFLHQLSYFSLFCGMYLCFFSSVHLSSIIYPLPLPPFSVIISLQV